MCNQDNNTHIDNDSLLYFAVLKYRTGLYEM